MEKQPYGAEALNEAVKKDYELVGWQGGHKKVMGKWSNWLPGGVLDLSKLTPAQAERLVEMGFPYLRKKPAPAATTTASKKDKE